MSGFETCEDCKQEFNNRVGHDCPGTPEYRIEKLEEEVRELKMRLDRLEEKNSS